MNKPALSLISLIIFLIFPVLSPAQTVSLPKPDLTVTTVTLDKTSVQAGGTINVTYTIKNLGPAASTGTSVTGFYLGNTQNGTQTYLYETAAVSITTVNGTTTKTVGITIPGITLPGSYYLVVYTDYNSLIDEDNEGNNTNGTPINVFKFEISGITLNAITSTTINISGIVTTTGSVVSNGDGIVSLQYEYQKPNTTTWVSYDTPVNVTTTSNSAVLFDEGFTPPFDLPGTWKLRCSSTVPNVINSNEVTVTVNEPLKPDITVTSVSLDRTSVQAGGSINVTYTIKNLGPAASTGTSLTGFYLENTQNGTQNFLYETSAVSITTVNGTTTLSARGTIPENTLPGNYFLVVYADHNNQIAESNEGNNTNGTPLTVFKFEVTGISLSTTTQVTINTGGAVTTTGNISGNGSGTVTVQYEYLKPNTTTWLAYDIPFNITMTNNSAALMNESYIPPFDLAGVWKLRCRSTVPNAVNSNEVSVTVNEPPKPDVTVTSVSLDRTTVQLGGTIYVTYTIKNLGPAASTGISTTGFYLGNTQNGTQTFLFESSAVSITSVNGTTTKTVRGTIPENILPGNYFLVVNADYTKQIDEANEGNNTYGTPLTLFKFEVTGITLTAATPVTINTGGVVNTTGSIAGNGSGTVTVQYEYQKPNTTTWVTYNSPYNVTMTNNSATLFNQSYTPFNLPGVWKLRCSSTTPNFVNSNEVTVTVNEPPKPDVTVTSVSLDKTSVQLGGTINVTYTIKNLGPAATTGTSISGIYLGNTQNGAQTFLYEASAASITTVNGTVTRTVGGIIPVNILPGNYYLVVYADHKNQIDEANEGNNTNGTPITVFKFEVTGITLNTATSATVNLGGAVNTAGNIFGNGSGTVTVQYEYQKPNTTIWMLYDTPFNITMTNNSATLFNETYTPPFDLPGVWKLRCRSTVPDAVYSNEVTVIVNEPPKPDLTVTSVSLDKTSVQAGGTINVTYTIKNLGPAASTGQSTTGFYLGNTQSGTQTFLYETSAISINTVNGTTTRTVGVTIPEIILPGSYYLVVSADHKSQIGEVNEGNNTNSTPIALFKFEVTGITFLITSPSSVNMGASVTTSGSIVGNGSGTITLQYEYQKPNSTIWVAYNSTSNVTMTNNSATLFNLSYSPPFDLPGVWKLRCRTTLPNAVNSNEVTVTVSDVPKPDLSVTSVSVDRTSIQAGGTINVTYTIKNLGPAASTGQSTTGFYLGNTQNGTQNYLYETSTVGINAVNGTTTMSARGIVPENILSGSYFLVVYADHNNQIDEANEGNNTYGIPITVFKFEVTGIALSATSPTVINIGGVVNTAGSITGNGTGTVSVQYEYLKPNTTTWVAYNSPSSITMTNNSATLFNESYTTPFDMPGDWKLRCRSITPNAVNSNEVNVTVNEPLKPDLTVTSVILNRTNVQVGGTINVTFTIKNIGPAPTTGTSLTGFYISDTQNGTQTYLYETSAASITSVNGTITKTVGGIIPENILPGNYFLVVYADHTKQIAEANEENNTNSTPITLFKFDVTGIALAATSPTTINIGGTVNTSGSMTGNGTGTVTVQYEFLKPNTTIWETYNSLSNVAMTNNSATLLNLSYTTPFDLPGVWKLRCRSTTPNTVNSNEVLVTVNEPLKPDLMVTSVSLDRTAAQLGGTINVTYTIMNSGPAASTGTSMTGFYLGNTQNGTQISLYETSAISINTVSGTTTRTVGVIIPANTLPGSYYFVVNADNKNQIDEANEGNNTNSTPVKVFKFEVSGITLIAATSSTINVGGILTTTGSITGNGAGTVTVQYEYQKPDTKTWVTYDTPSNVVMVNNSATLFDEGYTPPFDLTGVWKLRCSSTVPNIVNSNEITVVVNEAPKPDLTVTSVSLDKTSVQVGGTMNVTYTIMNLGPASSTGTSLTGFYLGNTQYGKQTYLAETWAATINSINGVETTTVGVVIPDNVLPGSYYLVVNADHKNLIEEVNKGNNTNGTPITLFKFEVTGITLNVTSSTTVNMGGATNTSGMISGNGTGTAIIIYEYQKPNTTTWVTSNSPSNVRMTNNSATLLNQSFNPPFDLPGVWKLRCRSAEPNAISSNEITIKVNEPPKPDLTSTTQVYINTPAEGQIFSSDRVESTWSVFDVSGGLVLSGLGAMYFAIDQSVNYLQLTESARSYTINNLQNGVHTIYIKSKDKDGNFSAVKQVSFSIDRTVVYLIPAFSTTSVSEITSTGATVGSNLISDGGASLSSRGVCWSTTANPTIELNTKTTDIPNTGYYASSITGLTAKTTYHVRAYATNLAGTAYGSDLTFTTLPPAPSAPAGNAATNILQTSFNANWNTSATATGYRLDVATNNGFTEFVDGHNNKDVGNVLTYSIPGLSANTLYYYRLRAYNAGGPGNNSNTVTTRTLPNPPDAPSANPATNLLQTSFNANWSISATASGYRLDVATNTGFTSFLSDYNDKDVSNVTTFSISGLMPNSPYYYRVRAYNAGGTGPGSGTIKTTTLPTPPDSPSANPATNILQTSFTANWITSATATGYRLDVATNIGFTSFAAGFNDRDLGDVSTFIVSGLNANTSYYYRLRAYNTGGASAGSGIITTKTLPNPPDAPTANPATNILQTSFIANWITSANASGYRLDVATDIGFTSFVNGLYDKDVSNVTTFKVTGLNMKTPYYYRLRAYNSGGTGANSNIAAVTTLTNPPAVPAGLTASSCNNLVTLKWRKNSDPYFGRYRIYAGTTNNPTFKIDSTSNNMSDTLKTISALQQGQTYYFRVTAVNFDGSESAFSSQSSATVKPGVVPRISAKWGDVVICYNLGDSIASFQWYKAGLTIPNAIGQYYKTNKQPGSYKVETIDRNGCKNSSNAISITGLKSLTVYPNPASVSFALKINDASEERAFVSIINSAGVKVMEFQANNVRDELLRTIPVSNLADGVYIVQVLLNQKDLYFTKIVVLK